LAMTAEQAPAQQMFADTTDEIFGGEDLGGLDPVAILRSMSVGFRNVPGLARVSAGLSAEWARVALGRSKIEAARGDWRFADPAWTENPGYRRLKQAYLAWSEASLALVDEANMEWREAERARFAMTILASAAAPTNYFLLNPAAVKRAFDTGGKSVARGARNFFRDLRHNRGMPSQVNTESLKVGEDLAMTPGAVIWRDERCELIRYAPSTPTVRARPVVVVPPQINKYYFLDLAPGRSFVEHEVSRGIQVLIVSWRNPGREHAEWGFDEYVTTILGAIDAARSVTDSDDVDVFGFCAGGITTAAALSHLAAVDDHRVNTASFAVTLLDFEVPAMIGMLADPGLLKVAKWGTRRAGVFDGITLGSIFSWLRPNDLVWNYWVNNFLLGEDPPVFDILVWNADPTNLPARLHGQFMDIFGKNLLCQPGALTVLGTPIDLSSIKVETYVTGATADHLTPWKGCYQATQLMSGPTTFVLSNAGHIAAQVNPPGNPKAHYFAGPEPGADPEVWLASAQRHQGTWWDHWADWALDHCPADIPAPKELGNDAYPVLAPAPGTYVHQRL
jgi:poly[(R)-3-hydroxyalkanoate] polymerase subunit PhaC